MMGVILFASAGIALPACVPFGCGAVGAVQGLQVDLAPSGGTLPDDEYTLVARADGLEATIVEDFRADGGGSYSGPVDLADGGKTLHVDLALGSSGGYATISYREGGGPAQIEVELQRGSAVVAKQTFTPSYTIAYPNGEACGPTSLAAEAQLTVTAP
jgi:hypothetical protein